jgi:hypothetical protein
MRINRIINYNQSYYNAQGVIENFQKIQTSTDIAIIISSIAVFVFYLR